MGNKSASRCGRMSNANEVTCCHLADYFFFFWFGRRVPAKIASCRGGWRVSCFRLRTKLAESWPAPPPPLLRHLLVPEPQQKGKRRAPSDAGGTGGTHFCWADWISNGRWINVRWRSTRNFFFSSNWLSRLEGPDWTFPRFLERSNLATITKFIKKIKLNRIKSSN